MLLWKERRTKSPNGQQTSLSTCDSAQLAGRNFTKNFLVNVGMGKKKKNHLNSPGSTTERFVLATMVPSLCNSWHYAALIKGTEGESSEDALHVWRSAVRLELSTPVIRRSNLDSSVRVTHTNSTFRPTVQLKLGRKKKNPHTHGI